MFGLEDELKDEIQGLTIELKKANELLSTYQGIVVKWSSHTDNFKIYDKELTRLLDIWNEYGQILPGDQMNLFEICKNLLALVKHEKHLSQKDKKIIKKLIGDK